MSYDILFDLFKQAERKTTTMNTVIIKFRFLTDIYLSVEKITINVP